jgi:hypothetical protein
VDQDVDTPERLGRLCERPFDVEIVGDVGADGERGPASARTSSTMLSAAPRSRM